MIESLNVQILDWKYGRNVVKSFITQLSDSDLDKPLLRKNLNSIRKQCEELVQVQTCYVEALCAKQISFTYEPLSDVSKEGLIANMDQLDLELKTKLEQFDGSEKIVWFGDEINIHQHT